MIRLVTDIFQDGVTDAMLDRLFALMAMKPDLTFQVLTKRAERMARYFNGRDSHLAMTRQFVNFGDYTEPAGPWPLPNVWLGVSVEDQARADERIPHLLATPAAVRFLSVEPLLGEVCFDTHYRGYDVNYLTGERWSAAHATRTRGVDWVIVGGESGPGARQCELNWIRSVVKQCRSEGVPVFCKQLGANVGGEWSEGGYGPHHVGKERFTLRDKKGGDMDEWPPDLRIRQFPKGVAS